MIVDRFVENESDKICHRSLLKSLKFLKWNHLVVLLDNHIKY